MNRLERLLRVIAVDLDVCEQLMRLCRVLGVLGRLEDVQGSLGVARRLVGLLLQRVQA